MRHAPSQPPWGSWLRSRDGLQLYYHLNLPEPRSALLWIVEGSEAGSTLGYPRFLQSLASRNIGVARFHPRGAGYSDGPRGDVEDYRLVIEDYRQFSREILGALSDIPVLLFGHSAGGALALEIAAQQTDRHAGLVLVNPAYKYRNTVGPTPGDMVRFGFNALFRRSALTVDMNRDPSGIRDPFDREEGVAMQRDPLVVRYYSMRYLMGLRRVLGRCVRNASRASTPLLFIQGARDGIIDPAGGEEIYAACPASDKTRWIVPERGHGAAVVEACADDITTWLATRAGAIRAR
jgi:acylglycerol lipase